MMLVVSGHSAELDRRGIELIAEHYGLDARPTDQPAQDPTGSMTPAR
ncbi:hypothetical protein [Brachybacterium sp. YJGR34]|nr:hypothetical protein [Brachybacterium sp. YJGR34]